MRRRLRDLYLVASSDTPLDHLEAALRGGGDLLQIWSPSRSAAEMEWAKRVVALVREYEVPVLVNNDLKLARTIGADGLHIDGDAPEPDEVRSELGAGALVGYTCGTEMERIRWSERVGADYISFCAMFPSPSVSECAIVPLEFVKEAKRQVEIPVFASGGITPENAPRVLETGADGLAIISGIFKAPDPEEAAKRFKALIERRAPMGES